MCGLAGYCLLHSSLSHELESFAVRMGSAIAHRGPDDHGVWADPALRVALVHQRLAIIDTSVAGHQPMQSNTGRFHIVFNGEIYNHLSIRRDLETAGLAPIWQGHSDTETLLAAIEVWGLEGAMNRCSGMWALALVDRQERRLHLARDRFGEKPLYWGTTANGQQRAFVFASQLSALQAYPGFNNVINRQALAEFFRLGHVPAPFSILEGIWKLPPAHCLSVDLPFDLDKPFPDPRPWWSLNHVIETGAQSPLDCESEALSYLECTLNQVISDQALSDVPLGAFLSGGIDSSLVSSLLQSQRTAQLRTFTIGFEDSGFNEAPYARAVAAHLGTDHTETILSSSDVLGLIPNLPRIYDEPFADSSQIPTYLVCREARRAGLSVVLSGDGGDELFGGYNRYSIGSAIWRRMALIPRPVRRRLGTALISIPPFAWDVFSGPLKVNHLGLKAHKLGNQLQWVTDSADFYNSLIHVWPDPASLVKGQSSPNYSFPQPTDKTLPACLNDNLSSRMMAWDALGYLPDDILVKVDRAAMFVALETRSPFLDNRLVSLAWRLPMSMKIKDGSSKWALRQILYKHVPRSMIERPKAGFAIPIGDWLRGPLRVWCTELLNPDRLELEGFIEPEVVNLLWQQHLSCRYDHTTKLWAVLMWQCWLEQWG